MATLTAAPSASAGVELVLAASACAAAGDQFANTGQELAIFTNASVGSITVTIVSAGLLDAAAIADRTVAVAAGATTAIGPLKPGVYNDAGGYVAMTYSTETDLSVRILKVTPST